MGIPLNDKEFEMLIAEVDNDGGGCIDYNEFAEDMKQHDQQTVDHMKGHTKLAGPAAGTMAVSQAGIGKNNVKDILRFIQDRVEQKSANLTKVTSRFIRWLYSGINNTFVRFSEALTRTAVAQLTMRSSGRDF